jgi:hypothetical protein
MTVTLTVKTADALEALRNDLSGLQKNLHDDTRSDPVDVYAVDQAVMQIMPDPEDFPFQLAVPAEKIAAWIEIAITDADGYNGDITLTGLKLPDADCLLIGTEEARNWLESDLEGRLEVLMDDGNAGSPSAEDIAALQEWLSPHTGPFPLLIPVALSAAQREELKASIENLNDYASEDAGDAAGNLHVVEIDDLREYADRLTLQFGDPPYEMNESEAHTFIGANLAHIALHCVAETEPHVAAEELNPRQE